MSQKDEATRLRNEAIHEIRHGSKEKGRQLLEQAVELNPNDEHAWLWLSSVVNTDEMRRWCMEKVLDINPANETAKKGLAKLPAPLPPPAVSTIPLQTPPLHVVPPPPKTWQAPPPQVWQGPPQQWQQPPPGWMVYAAPPPTFTTKAVLTLVLYFIFWFPGLIANLIFLSEANQVKNRMGGQEPEGHGCLVAMLAIQLAAMIFVCVFGVIG